MLGKFFSKKSGFTLVELLIVVAIIGVLSTLGVPTFKRMIQKSKKSEARVNLGGLFTAENAFQAEYNTYGNNLERIGFQIEGNPATLTYRVGFYAAGCGGNTAAEPSNVAIQAALQASFPQYYIGYTDSNSWAGFNGGGTAPTNCYPNTVPAISVAANGTAFTAVAAGSIAPAVSKLDGTGGRFTAGDQNRDVWTINNQRDLINQQDGVQ